MSREQNGYASMYRPLSRRRFALGASAVAAGLALPVRFAAAQATSTGGDVPEVRFTVTGDAITGPAEITAGINRVTIENQTGQVGVHMITLQLPDGATVQTVEDWVKSLSPEENSPMPGWWLKATMVGNPDWAPDGGVSEGYIDYPAGTYVIMNIFGNQLTLASFTVKEGAKAAEPVAEVTVESKLMSFTGLDGITTGRHLWKITNTDMVAHELSFLSVPNADVTVPEIIDMLMAANEFPKLPAGYAVPPGGTGILTPGAAMWLDVDLPAGHYAAVCFAPDGWNGPPHAMMGMIKTFTVK